MATNPRSKELADKVYHYHMDDVNDLCEMDIGNLCEWFDQALLAERKETLDWVDKQLEQCLGAIKKDANPDVIISGLRLRLVAQEALRGSNGK